MQFPFPIRWSSPSQSPLSSSISNAIPFDEDSNSQQLLVQIWDSTQLNDINNNNNNNKHNYYNNNNKYNNYNNNNKNNGLTSRCKQEFVARMAKVIDQMGQASALVIQHAIRIKFL